MKLGVAYNVFDGEELLEYSILQIREFASVVAVVYQEVSNFGNTNPTLLKTLNELKDKGLIDIMVDYKPTLESEQKYHNQKGDGSVVNGSGTYNEQNKRNIGLDICKANGCDVFMTMDCDELYDKKEFEFALKDFENGGYDTSFVQMQTYYKLPTMQVEPPEKYYCPLLYKINSKSKLEYIEDYPVLTDPTRRIRVGHPRVYSRDEIQMYHYAYVRHNLDSKVANSSAQTSTESKEAVKKHFDNWSIISDGALMIGMQSFGLKEVENKFNIEL